MDLFNSLVFVAQIYEDLRLGVSCSEKKTSKKTKKISEFAEIKATVNPRRRPAAVCGNRPQLWGNHRSKLGAGSHCWIIVRNFTAGLLVTIVMEKKMTEAGMEDYDKLRAEAERLRKELREQKMRAEALDTMIDVAEEMFDIPIRRKTDDKR